MDQDKPQPPNQQKLPSSQPILLQHVQQFSAGPLPDPNTLAQYAKIYPGLEKTIVEMAQRQSQHRIETEKLIIQSREKQSLRGQLFAFISMILILCVSLVFIYKDAIGTATFIITTTLVSIIGLFLTGKNKQSKPPKTKEQSTR